MREIFVQLLGEDKKIVIDIIMSIIEFIKYWVEVLIIPFAIVILGKKFKKQIKQLFIRIFDTGAINIYLDAKEANSDICKDYKVSKTLRIFTSRGEFLKGNPFKDALGKPEYNVKILMPKTLNYSIEYNWIYRRAMEMNQLDENFNENVLKGNIETNIDYLENSLKKHDTKLRLYDNIHLGKLIMFDKTAYFTPYQSNKFGQDTTVYKYRSGTTMYNWMERIFEQIWDVSDEYQISTEENFKKEGE